MTVSEIGLTHGVQEKRSDTIKAINSLLPLFFSSLLLLNGFVPDI